MIGRQHLTKCKSQLMSCFLLDVKRRTKDYIPDRVRKQYVEREMKFRKRSIDLTRFIGELFKEKILNGWIMHKCIKEFLQQSDKESLDCL